MSGLCRRCRRRRLIEACSMAATLQLLRDTVRAIERMLDDQRHARRERRRRQLRRVAA